MVSGTATATGTAWAVCARRHSRITALVVFMSARAALRTASTVGNASRPASSNSSFATAVMRSRISAGIWLMVGDSC